jgi:hypothetical protein
MELPDIPSDVEHPVVGESDRTLDAEHGQLFPACQQFLQNG